MNACLVGNVCAPVLTGMFGDRERALQVNPRPAIRSTRASSTRCRVRACGANVGQSAYGAAKAAIANLTVVTALEARRYGVAVNAISPLAVTRISEDFFGGEKADDPALDPARSSEVVAWLHSPDSAWLTGQILRVNGDALSRIEGFAETLAHYHAKDGAFAAVLRDRPGGELAVRHITARTGRTVADGLASFRERKSAAEILQRALDELEDHPVG